MTNKENYDDIKNFKLPTAKISFMIGKLFDYNKIDKESKIYLQQQLICLNTGLFKIMEKFEKKGDIEILKNQLIDYCKNHN